MAGDTLMQICLDPFGIQFRFERNSLTSELALEHEEPDGTLWRYACVASEAPASVLHRLVGRTVASVATESFRLTLTFDNGATLRIISDDGPYEAGHIAGDGNFIVF